MQLTLHPCMRRCVDVFCRGCGKNCERLITVISIDWNFFEIYNFCDLISVSSKTYARMEVCAVCVRLKIVPEGRHYAIYRTFVYEA